MDSFQVVEMYIFIAILLLHILTECKLFNRWMKLLKKSWSVNFSISLYSDIGKVCFGGEGGG